MKIALAIMFIGIIFAFSESATMVPNFFGAIAFMFSGIYVGNFLHRNLKP